MKFLGYVGAFLSVLVFAGTAQAATLSVVPTTVSVVAGQTFSEQIQVAALGSKVVTVRSDLVFPSDLLEVTSFVLAPSWVALTQNGYDSITAGEIVKTAGYPGGFTDSKMFGTVTFRAKRTGTATIAVASTSLIYSAQNDKVLAGTAGAQITITPSAAQQVPATQGTANTSGVVAGVSTQTGTGGVIGSGAATGAESTSTVATTTDGSQAAAVGDTETKGIPLWLWFVIAALLVAGGGYWFYRLTNKTV